MKRSAFVLSIIILFAIPSSAFADIAPPRNPPGSNLDPGSEVTQVRMLAETVLLEVQKDMTPGSLGQARVTADYTLRARLYRNFQVVFGKELPALPLYVPVYSYGVDSQVQGVQVGAAWCTTRPRRWPS